MLLAFIATIISNIMSNTAAASLLIPIGITLLPDEILMVSLTIGLSASTALFLPISTPPNAIAFGTGYLKQPDFRLIGVLLAVIGPSLILLILNLFF
jgi:sodium-dependent dicarboxylate transporter 2/3/5